MPRLKRSCSYNIITRAVHPHDQPLVAQLMPDLDDCPPCLDQHQLRAGLNDNRESIIVYNQQADAPALVDSPRISSHRINIESRQDTRGVPGLPAIRDRGHQPETLEFIYQ